MKSIAKWMIAPMAWVVGWFGFVCWLHAPILTLPVLPSDSKLTRIDRFLFFNEAQTLVAQTEVNEPPYCLMDGFPLLHEELGSMQAFDMARGTPLWRREQCSCQGDLPSKQLLLRVVVPSCDRLAERSAEVVELRTGNVVATVPLSNGEIVHLREEPPGWQKTNVPFETDQVSPDGRTTNTFDWQESHYPDNRAISIGTMTFFDTKSGEALGAVETARGYLRYPDDGELVLYPGFVARTTALTDIGLCQLRPFRLLKRFEDLNFEDCKISKHGRWLYGTSLTYQNPASIVETVSGRKLTSVDDRRFFKFTADERYAVCYRSGKLTVYDLPGERVLAEWDGMGDSPIEVMDSPQLQLYASTAGSLPSWIGKILNRLPSSFADRFRLYITPRTVRLDATTRKQLDSFPGQFLAVNRKETCLVTKFGDERILVWNLNHWRPGPLTTLLIATIGPLTAYVVSKRRASTKNRTAIRENPMSF